MGQDRTSSAISAVAAASFVTKSPICKCSVSQASCPDTLQATVTLAGAERWVKGIKNGKGVRAPG